MEANVEAAKEADPTPEIVTLAQEEKVDKQMILEEENIVQYNGFTAEDLVMQTIPGLSFYHTVTKPRILESTDEPETGE